MGNLLKFDFGKETDKPIIYFHGAPGAIEEAGVFSEAAIRSGRRILCFDRFAIDKSINGDAYFKHIADAIISEVGSRKVDIVGFSIGAYIAIEVSQKLGDQVGELHLISAAAPLDAGDFLPHMAGKPIFGLAKNHPKTFSLLVLFQSFLAKLLPSILFGMLFSSAAGGDKDLVSQKKFKNFIVPILKQSYKNSGVGFARDVKQYVNWSLASIEKQAMEVFIWHGQADNWSPISMASGLAEIFPQSSSYELKELSHYSTLYAVSDKIFEPKTKSDD